MIHTALYTVWWFLSVIAEMYDSQRAIIIVLVFWYYPIIAKGTGHESGEQGTKEVAANESGENDRVIVSPP